METNKLITRDQYLEALDIVEAYHRQIEIKTQGYKDISQIEYGDQLECTHLSAGTKNLTVGKLYTAHKVEKLGNNTYFTIYKDNGKSRWFNIDSSGARQFLLRKNQQTEEQIIKASRFFLECDPSPRLCNVLADNFEKLKLSGTLSTLTIKELSKVPKHDLRKCRNCGNKSIKEFIHIITSHGLSTQR
jgi:hypothetical protein